MPAFTMAFMLLLVQMWTASLGDLGHAAVHSGFLRAWRLNGLKVRVRSAQQATARVKVELHVLAWLSVLL